MSDEFSTGDNPYQVPKAKMVEEHATSEAGFELLAEPRRVPASYGWHWFTEGFVLFRENWQTWIAVLLIWMGISMALSNIPLVGMLSPIITPLLSAGIMYTARLCSLRQEVTFSYLFRGFEEKPKELFIVGGIYLGYGIFIWVVAIACALAIVGLDPFIQLIETQQFDSGQFLTMYVGVVVGILVLLTLALPLIMMIWFAPALVMFHSISPWQALVLSMKGCWHNVWPLTVFSGVFIGFCIVALLPFLLPLSAGLLFLVDTWMLVIFSIIAILVSAFVWVVLIPVLWITIYAQYRDIFLAENVS